MATVRVCVASEVPGLFSALSRACADIGGVQLVELSLQDCELGANLASAEVVICEPAFALPHLPLIAGPTSRVRWLHSLWAGVEKVTALPKPPFPVTRHVGSFGQQMGEYVVGQIIARERGFWGYWSAQQARKWVEDTGCPCRDLCALSIGILGVGEIGKKVAEFCKGLGMTVWGMTRASKQCPSVDHSCHPDDLPDLLQNCDYVCNVLPSTRETRGLFDGDVLSHCREKKSVFINIGRGDVVKDATIVKAIREGWVGGAILDVFEDEPLHPDSELWDMPEVVITPHVSGKSLSNECAELAATNLRLFMAGKDLLYQLDWNSGY